MSTDPLTPDDAACLRMLAGANFLGGDVILPSGRRLTPDEAQALSSAYAPALNEGPLPPQRPAHYVGYSPTAMYVAGGGDLEANPRTAEILRLADEASQRRHARGDGPDR